MARTLRIEEIDAVQWPPVLVGSRDTSGRKLLIKIQAAGKAAVLYGNCEEIKSFYGKYKPELVVYHIEAASESEGIAFLDWLKKNT